MGLIVLLLLGVAVAAWVVTLPLQVAQLLARELRHSWREPQALTRRKPEAR